MKDYYLALGVERDADPETIKKAYRQFCKKYHPDSCDTDNAATRKEFLAIREAYDTLSDRDRRRDYDRNFGQKKKQNRGHDSGTEPGYGPKNELYAELVLSKREAAVGGAYRLEVPIRESCPYCSRFGSLSSLFCPVCGGRGRIRRVRPIILEVPAGVAAGTRNTVRLETEGPNGVFLTIAVAVE